MAYPDIQLGVDGYCTLAHIEALNPLRSYSTDTQPTRVQVAMAINDGYHDINGVLDVLGYQIPVASSAATATRMLRHLNALYAASSVEESAYSAGNTERSSHADVLKERFVNEWKQFREGKKLLIGATRTDDALPLINEKHPEYQFRLDNGGNEEDPTFKIDMKF